MRTLLLSLIILLALAALWFFVFKKDRKGDDRPHTEPVAVSQYSPAFNASLLGMLDQYHGLTEALVRWDSLEVDRLADSLKLALDSINLEEVKKDTVIYQTAPMYLGQARAEAATMRAVAGLQQKRHAFNRLSESLYNLLRVVKYDQQKLYWQECPMALNGYEESGFWLSDSARIRNPYLGLKDPQYGSGMLKCGETRDSLAYGEHASAPGKSKDGSK